MKEEGGTPDIVGTIRLALAFELKTAVGQKFISCSEREIARYRTVLVHVVVVHDDKNEGRCIRIVPQLELYSRKCSK